MFFEHIELVIPLGYPRPEVREAVGEIFAPQRRDVESR